MSRLTAFIEGMPKCERHVHAEGAPEPETKFQLAQRNRAKPPHKADVAPGFQGL